MKTGPKNITLYHVDLLTGEIDTFKTSKFEMDCDLANGDVFATRKEAQRKVDELLKSGMLKNTLVDTTDWEFPYEDEDELSTLDYELANEADPMPVIRKRLRIEIADEMANIIKKNKGLDNLLVELRPSLERFGLDEEYSIEKFVEYLENDDKEGPALSSKTLSNVYKTKFLKSV